MNHRTVHLDPDPHQTTVHRTIKSKRAAFNLNATFVKLQFLAENGIGRGKRIRGEAQANTAKLEILILFGQTPAPLHIEKDLSVLDPNIQADIPAAARHGL